MSIYLFINETVRKERPSVGIHHLNAHLEVNCLYQVHIRCKMFCLKYLLNYLDLLLNQNKQDKD
jgi:hypothetical protein